MLTCTPRLFCIAMFLILRLVGRPAITTQVTMRVRVVNGHPSLATSTGPPRIVFLAFARPVWPDGHIGDDHIRSDQMPHTADAAYTTRMQTAYLHGTITSCTQYSIKPVLTRTHFCVLLYHQLRPFLHCICNHCISTSFFSYFLS